jgi:hypothetical protein
MDGPAGRLRDLEAEVVWLRARVEDLEHERLEAFRKNAEERRGEFLADFPWLGG